jgi:putative ABC transport system ATP-binding protein
MHTVTERRQDRGSLEDPGIEGENRDAPPAIVLWSVTKRYGRARHGVLALQDVTAEIPGGSFSAVMGLSGSGKSTFLQMAAGLDRPTSGTVHLGGIDLATLSRRKLSVLRRQHVGFVFQSLNLIPSLSVAENIALPLRLDRKPVDKHEIAALAELVGIADQLRRLPATLSGGQAQRVAIARALATHPEVVFADEPTAALDPASSAAVVELLRHAVDELGQTVVVVTHAPTVAARADRVLLLDQGRLAGTLTAPSAAELAARLQRLGAIPRDQEPAA